MLSRFFIDRPIFATVLSVVITLVGCIALVSLPIAQYPRITPPGVSVAISYPGASAQVVAETVAAPIEQQVTGVPGMLYMSSQSATTARTRSAAPLTSAPTWTRPWSWCRTVSRSPCRCCRQQCSGRASPSASGRRTSC